MEQIQLSNVNLQVKLVSVSVDWLHEKLFFLGQSKDETFDVFYCELGKFFLKTKINGIFVSQYFLLKTNVEMKKELN